MISHRLLQNHDFALVDRLQHPVSELPAGVDILPLIPPGLCNSSDLMPWLIPLSGLSESQLVECLDRMETQQRERRPLLFSTLLKSNAAVKRVIGHFCTTLVAHVVGGQEAVYLRQFDPRLFIQYDWLLSAEQRQQLFGPVAAWTVYSDGEWQTFRPLAEEAVSRSSVLRLTSHQAAQLDDLQLINEALTLLPLAGGAERQQWARKLYRLLERGRGYGVTRRHDVAIFLRHGVTVHAEFDQHPLAKHCLQDMQEGVDLPYTIAIANLDETKFQQIRIDMNQGAGGPSDEP